MGADFFLHQGSASIDGGLSLGCRKGWKDTAGLNVSSQFHCRGNHR